MTDAREWRRFRDFNYEVDATGHVRSLKTGKPIKPSFSWNGYATVSMFHGGKYHRKMLSRVVAECWVFFAEIPRELHVNHIDFNIKNNRADNLEILPPKENVAHSVRAGRMATGERNGMRRHPETVQRGSEHYLSKLKEADVLKMRQMHKDGMSCPKIAALFKVGHRTAYNAITGRSWAHV